MSKYEHLKQHSSDERLQILRHEIRRQLNTIQSAITVLGLIDPKALNGLPESLTPEALSSWISKLANATKEIDNLLEELTSTSD